MDVPKPRSMPPIRYIATERRPDLDITGQRHARQKPKIFGHLNETRRVNRAARLVIGVDRLVVLVQGKCAFADPAHHTLGGAVLGRIECLDAHDAGVFRPHITDIACRNLDLGLKRRIKRHHGDELIAGLKHGAHRQLRDGQHHRGLGRRELDEILAFDRLVIGRSRDIQIVARFNQLLAQLREPLLLESIAVGGNRGRGALGLDQRIVRILDGADQFKACILSGIHVQLRPGAMLCQRGTHILDLLRNILALAVAAVVPAEFGDGCFRLLDLRVEAVDLRIILRHALVIERLLQQIVVFCVLVRGFIIHERLAGEFRLVARICASSLATWALNCATSAAAKVGSSVASNCPGLT